jgi:hypothetical protein
METLTLCRPPLYRIPLSQRMPKAFLARLDSPALPDQPEPPMYVPGSYPLCAQPSHLYSEPLK